MKSNDFRVFQGVQIRTLRELKYALSGVQIRRGECNYVIRGVQIRDKIFLGERKYATINFGGSSITQSMFKKGSANTQLFQKRECKYAI